MHYKIEAMGPSEFEDFKNLVHLAVHQIDKEIRDDSHPRTEIPAGHGIPIPTDELPLYFGGRRVTDNARVDELQRTVTELLARLEKQGEPDPRIAQLEDTIKNLTNRLTQQEAKPQQAA